MKLLFENKDRISRTVLLRCLSGSHFASENFCVEFKLQNQRNHRKCTSCPFCGNAERGSLFVNVCPKFDASRKKFRGSLVDARVEPPENLMDVFQLFFVPFNIKENFEQVGILREVSFEMAEFLVEIKGKFAS